MLYQFFQSPFYEHEYQLYLYLLILWMHEDVLLAFHVVLSCGSDMSFWTNGESSRCCSFKGLNHSLWSPKSGNLPTKHPENWKSMSQVSSWELHKLDSM